MAIFHCSINAISRTGKKGGIRSAVGAAAYRAGIDLWDDRNKITHSYTGRSGVVRNFIITPDNAPTWTRDRALLWNIVEHMEKRKDSRLARDAVLALPHEFDLQTNEQLVRQFATMLIQKYGVVVDVAMHLPDREGDERNHHAHVMFTTRGIEGESFGKKTALDDWKKGPEEIKAIRLAWETIVNDEFKAKGMAERIDHRSHKDKGLDVPPQIHEGVNVTAMKRQGKEPKGSVIQHDFRGREINYPEIDQGQTRAQHNADVIDLQKYRQPETVPEKLARINATIADTAATLEELQAALNSGLLSDDNIARLRVRIEQLVSQIFRKGEETEFLRARREEQAKARQIDELQTYLDRLYKIQEELQAEVQKEKDKRETDQRLFAATMAMWGSLNGWPPHKITLEIPPSAQFNEAASLGALRRQSTAQLLEAVLSPPTLSSKPALATVNLRQDVLQVKELLSRTKPKLPQGVGKVAMGQKFASRASRRS